MNVRDTVRRMLLLYPGVTLNALDAYDHMFCVIGNGYEWKDGELVELSEDSNKVPTLKEAIDKVLKFRLVDNTTVCGLQTAIFALHTDDMEQIKQDLIKYNKRMYDALNEDISLIMRVDERLEDLEPHTVGRYLEVRHFYEFNFYGLSEYSKLCCLPDDIKPDWLEAAEYMLDFIKTHKYLWHKGDEEWIPKIESRIKELKTNEVLK